MYNSELYHYGVKGMKWGVRKKRSAYRSTSLRSAMARRQNEKVDAGFKKWDEGAKNRDNAIALGKKANKARIAYENNRSDKQLRKDYKASKKEYKKALSKNTTYRKGTVKQEVGRDSSRKYLSQAKKIKKQLDNDPTNKKLKKQYNKSMSKHDVERAKARRAQSVAQKRSAKKASMKATFKKSVKAAVATGVTTAGIYAANKYLANGRINVNAPQVLEYVKKAKKFMQYF